MERKLNEQCEKDISEYGGKQSDFSTKQEVYNKSTEQINKLQNELSTVTDELQHIKGRMDERGSAMTDTSPIVKIKAALTKIKQEARAMEIRIGVVSHTIVLKRLGSNSMTARSALQPSILAGGGA
ncbi:intra-flagellar transport protein 57-domain-containing protein [Pavlovales sp. CCMP2436]|nr:intra-flagellar transport protein 57-domain-containing protein [Pavlovales sp. CCMP2436]